MSKDDNEADYFEFSSHPTLNVTGLSLFSQIRDELETGSSIVTSALPRLYFKNIFFIIFILYFNKNNNNNNN